MPRNKTYTIQDLISRATTCFWEKGFEASSIDDLVNATGVNRKILYDNFYNKEGLFTETLKQVIFEREAKLFAILDTKPHSIENIRSALRYLSQELEYRGCMIMLTLDERAHTPARAFILAEQHFMRFKALIELNLEVSANGCTRFADLIAAQYAAMSTLSRLGYDQNQLNAAFEPLLTQIQQEAQQAERIAFHKNLASNLSRTTQASSKSAVAAYSPPLGEEQKQSEKRHFLEHLVNFAPLSTEREQQPAA